MIQPTPFSKFRSVAGEFIIIVGGVLVALLVDEWRGVRADRALETQYVHRLREDLAWDIENSEEFEAILATKASVLQDLLSDDPIRRLNEHENLIEDLIYSNFKALPANRTSTFQELQSTGNLHLIRDLELRGRISQYYLGYDHISGVLASPSGEYRELVSQAIPADAIQAWRLDGISPEPSALEEGVRVLLGLPNLKGAANSELGYTAGLVFYLRDFKLQATGLLAELEEPS